MKINNIFIDIIILGILLIVVDAFFLKAISPLFNNMLMSIQGTGITLDPISTIGCYLVIVGGLYYFIIKDKKPVLDAMLLGWFVYLVYELTNKAIMPKWRWMAVFIDGTWGGILFGLTTYLYYLIRHKI